MTAVFSEFQHLLIGLDAKPGELTNSGAVAIPSTISDGDVTKIQVASVNTTQGGTTEPLK